MSSKKIVKEGTKVALAFILKVANGSVVDKAISSDPLIFTIGDGVFSPNLEHKLFGLKERDKMDLFIPSEDGFGAVDKDYFHVLERSKFPAEMQLTENSLIEFDIGENQKTTGRIVHINAKEVEVDFNHPLAGLDLEFKVEIIKIY